MGNNMSFSGFYDNFLRFHNNVVETIKEIPDTNQCDSKVIEKVNCCVQEALNLEETYKPPENSSLNEKFSFYDSLYQNLKGLSEKLYDSKPFFEKIKLILFSTFSIGSPPPNEEKLYSTFSRIEKIRNKVKNDEDNLWGQKTGFTRSLGLFLKRTFIHPHSPLHQLGNDLAQSDVERTQVHYKRLAKTLPDRLKEAAYRVMGNERFEGGAVTGQVQSRSIDGIKDNLAQFLEKFKENLPEDSQEHIQRNLNTLERAHEFSLLCDTVLVHPDKSNNSKRIEDIVFKLKQSVSKLRPGEEVLFPGSVFYNEGGHAVLFSFKREKEGTFTFTIINTGAGIEILKSTLKLIWSVAISGKFSDQAFTDLTLDQITDSSFLKHLVSKKALPDQDTGIKDLYEPIITHFRKFNKTMSDGREHTLQTNGTCSFSSIMSWMEGSLDPSLFRCIELYMIKYGSASLDELSRKPHTYFTGLRVKKENSVLQGLEVLNKLKEVGKRFFEQRSKELEQTILAQQEEDGKIQRKKEQLTKSKEENTQKWNQYRAAAQTDRLEGLEANLRVAAENYRQANNGSMSEPGFLADKGKKELWKKYQIISDEIKGIKSAQASLKEIEGQFIKITEEIEKLSRRTTLAEKYRKVAEQIKSSS